MVHIQWLSYIITLWWAMVIHNHYSCQVFSWSQKTMFQDFRGWQNKINKNVHILFRPQKKMPRSVLIYGIWWYNYIPVCIIRKIPYISRFQLVYLFFFGYLCFAHVFHQLQHSSELGTCHDRWSQAHGAEQAQQCSGVVSLADPFWQGLTWLVLTNLKMWNMGMGQNPGT